MRFQKSSQGNSLPLCAIRRNTRTRHGALHKIAPELLECTLPKAHDLAMWYKDVLGAIGNTPLIQINLLSAGLPCTVLAKVESFNPGASLKDRIAVVMVEEAEARGDLRPGGTIIEGTSGNTGAGLALVAIAKGYKCICTTTSKQSKEKIDVLEALGAKVIICPNDVEPDDPRSYYSVARRLAQKTPGSHYMNQYDNLDNTKAHYLTTGPEIWQQTEGRITYLFSGAGTGGTISGVARYLKEQNPSVRIIGVDPYGSLYHKYFHTGEVDPNEIQPYLTEGAGEDIMAKNMDFGLVDDYTRVNDKQTMQMARRLAREEGIFAGQSSGLAMAGALQWMRENQASLSTDDVAVVILPDSGFRYLRKTYNDDWMRKHNLL